MSVVATLCYCASMHYSKDGKWTPMPITERMKKAGIGLLVPPALMALWYGIVVGGFKGLFFLFPSLRGTPHPWAEMPFITTISILASLWLLITYEMAILNRDYVTFEEMVLVRLAALEEEGLDNF